MYPNPYGTDAPDYLNQGPYTEKPAPGTDPTGALPSVDPIKLDGAQSPWGNAQSIYGQPLYGGGPGFGRRRAMRDAYRNYQAQQAQQPQVPGAPQAADGLTPPPTQPPANAPTWTDTTTGRATFEQLQAAFPNMSANDIWNKLHSKDAPTVEATQKLIAGMTDEQKLAAKQQRDARDAMLMQSMNLQGLLRGRGWGRGGRWGQPWQGGMVPPGTGGIKAPILTAGEEGGALGPMANPWVPEGTGGIKAPPPGTGGDQAGLWTGLYGGGGGLKDMLWRGGGRGDWGRVSPDDWTTMTANRQMYDDRQRMVDERMRAAEAAAQGVA